MKNKTGTEALVKKIYNFKALVAKKTIQEN